MTDSPQDADQPRETNAGNHSKQASSERLGVAEKSSGGLPLILGGLLSAGFYAVVSFSGLSALERYFLGHPVAIAATVLFCVGLAILGLKAWSVRRQWRLVDELADESLAPDPSSDSPSDRFRQRHDAGFVAQYWARQLAELAQEARQSRLVVRLREVLTRQSGRGTTKHLADDLRELSARDADAAHDSFALVRIIVWAIPMLGFLGTVIGITQTLGGLDFSNGNAAVDNLKSGLYVAFDTTALGLVLSVVAIFLQFPVERSEQRLLAEIDERVGHLTGLHLPGDEPADNQYELLAQLCDGVRAAVEESLENQARLWRETIDAAESHWQQTQQVQTDGILSVIEDTLCPALRDHADRLEFATEKNQGQLSSQFDRWQSQLHNWQEVILAGAEAMTKQQALMLDQVDQAALVREQASSVLQLQRTLATNVEMLEQSNRQIDENLAAATGQGMADAMIMLARAVDVLNHRLAQRPNAHDSNAHDSGGDASGANDSGGNETTSRSDRRAA
jgi:biopolymer transport protein ExbB/TolQ